MSSISIEASLGPFFLGSMLATLLQGVTMYQAGVFWMSLKRAREPMAYIVVVVLVCILDLVHTGFSINTVYFWVAKNYDVPTVLLTSPWSFTFEPLLTGITAALCQGFYADRLRIAADGHWLGRPAVVIIGVLSLMQLAFAAAVTAQIRIVNDQFLLFNKYLWLCSTWLSSAAACDVVIVCFYGFFLRALANQMSSPFARGSKTVIQVAVIILCTNGASAAAAICATVVFGTMSGTQYYVLPGLLLPKLLALSLLICLNARSLLADMLDIDQDFFHSHKLHKAKLQSLTHQLNRSRGNDLDFVDSNMPQSLTRATSRSTIGGGQISPVYPINITRSHESRLQTGSFGEVGKEEEIVIDSCNSR